MAKILRMSHFANGNSTLSPAKNQPVLPHSGRMDGNHFRPSHTPEPVTDFFWQRSSSLPSIGAEARLLLVIGVVCGLLIYENGRKSAMASPKEDKQLQAQPMPRPAQSIAPLSKPTPVVPADTVRGERSMVSKQTPDAVPHPASSATQYAPMRYEATRKKVFGGCTGQLELTGSELVFRCPDQADLIFPVAAIAKAHKDGIVLKSGEKYHFLIANHTRGQVEAIFISWLNRVQQSPQASRESSL
jgi:hypothetical protein